jgi:hypothetical protein
VNHYYTHYTPSERLALHEYALSKAKRRADYPFDELKQRTFLAACVSEGADDREVSSSNFAGGSEIQQKSLHAEEKKRRRPKSYRTSGSSKSYTHELKALIESQMDLMFASDEICKSGSKSVLLAETNQSKKRKQESPQLDAAHVAIDAREKRQHRHKHHKHHKHKHRHENKTRSRSGSQSRL